MKKLIFFILTTAYLFGAGPKFLMPEEAFKPSATLNKNMSINAKIELGKSIYIYDDSLKISLKDSKNISIKEVKKPKSIEHDGDKVHIDSPILITVELAKNKDAVQAEDIQMELSYQGCSEDGLCYEPETKTYTFKIETSKLILAKEESATPSLPSLSAQTAKAKQTEAEQVKLSQSDEIAEKLKHSSTLFILLTFLGFGILLSLTPCVFPMIPIISGIIISHGEGLTTKKAFVLSVVYVLSMSVAYTIAGVLAGLFGANIQAALQSPIAIYSFSAIFVLLALSMFDFYELKLPDAFVSKISSNNNRHGYIGVAIMGFLSALIVGPCVAAPLAGALVYIGQTGDALLGGMALFVMSIGMGLPLIVVGVSAGRFMPKPGGWMTTVSVIFGIIMLGVAIWMLERVVDAQITMLLFAALGIGSALYFEPFVRETHIFQKTVGAVLLLYSTLLFIGAVGGSKHLSSPLEFLVSTTTIQSEQKRELEFKTVKSIKELDAILEANKDKKVLLDFSAEWCAVCKELEEQTFSDKKVQDKMSEFILIRADVTENSQESKELSKKYGVFGPPVIIFFDKEHTVLHEKSVVGFMSADDLLKHTAEI